MVAPTVDTKPDTRAVLRQIEAGNDADCPGCGNRVKFNSKQASADRKRVVANVYKGRGKNRHWDRTEQWHHSCYVEAGSPHGEVG